MKYTIEAIENAKPGMRWEEIGCQWTLGQAYLYSKEAGNDLPNFAEVIWDYDIPEIVKALKENGISKFTISSTFSSLIETLAAFEKEGIRMAGLTEVNATYSDWKTGKKARILAIRMAL